MKLRLLALAAVLLTLTACGSLTTPVKTGHVLLFDKHARPLDPAATPFRFFSEERYEDHVRTVIDGVKAQPPDPNGVRHVVIYVHGGLNNPVGTVNRATKRADEIKPDAYPIFFNWASPLTSSYWDHLVRVSQGKYYRKSRAIFLVDKMRRDAARALLRWPEVTWDGIASWVKRPDRDPTGCSAPASLDEYRADRAAAVQPKMWAGQTTPWMERGCDCTSRRQRLGDGTMHVLTSPIAYVPGQLILDSGGTDVWSVLLRRTDVLFHPNGAIEGKERYVPQGNLTVAYFLEQLIEATHGQKYSITLIGHSMGAIVVNHMLREYGARLPIDNVVYFAAACSIGDYESSVIPFLSVRPGARMFHVTLHPQRERRDHWLYLTPRGTLLVWIDRFLANPASPRDFTAGRYENIFFPLVEATPDELRPRVYLKVLRAGSSVSDTDPQRHGGFGSKPYPFWKETFWKPAAPIHPCP